jgi:hypothetical protein
MAEAGSSKTSAIVNDSPMLHFWGGEWRVGGMGKKQLELLLRCAEYVSSDGSVEAIETGAGLSTLVLLSRNISLHSFFVEKDLETRILEAADRYELNRALWKREVGFSEFTLPIVTQRIPPPRYSLALIDGGHGIQTVFTDFTYIFSALNKGGMLLIDDVQLASCGLLYWLLRRERGVRLFAAAGKLVAFEKLTSDRLLSSWASKSALTELATVLKCMYEENVTDSQVQQGANLAPEIEGR